jgi:hypothetical protein
MCLMENLLCVSGDYIIIDQVIIPALPIFQVWLDHINDSGIGRRVQGIGQVHHSLVVTDRLIGATS